MIQIKVTTQTTKIEVVVEPQTSGTGWLKKHEHTLKDTKGFILEVLNDIFKSLNGNITSGK